VDLDAHDNERVEKVVPISSRTFWVQSDAPYETRPTRRAPEHRSRGVSVPVPHVFRDAGLMSEMLSERLLDDRGLRLAPSARLRSGGADDVLLQLDGQRLLSHGIHGARTKTSGGATSSYAPPASGGTVEPDGHRR
jgi:hypothetical protein